MIKTICDILGCTRRRQQRKELASELDELQKLLDQQKKYQARIADEEDWFRKICTDTSLEVANGGRVPAPVPVHLDS